MGTFLGHILPGTFFFIYGLLYIVKDAFSLSVNSKKKSRPSTRSHGELSPPSEHNKDKDEGLDRSVFHGKVENGASSTSNGWESFDFESDHEETCLFSREADDAFPPDSEHKLETRDQDLHSDSLEEHDTDGQLRIKRKCSPLKEWLTNVLIIEGILKIACGIFGAIEELWWGGWYMISPRTGNFTNMNNWQHATMFTYFAVSGVADIVFQTCLKSRSSSSSDRPREKIFLSLAFSVEGLLFFFHTHGREEIDVHIHILLVIAILVCAVGAGLETWLYSPASPGVRRLWITATCVQGTWFWQIAFVLYNPWRDTNTTHEVGDDEVMHNIMMMTTMFTWHVLAVLSITCVIHVIVRYFSKFRCCKN